MVSYLSSSKAPGKCAEGLIIQYFKFFGPDLNSFYYLIKLFIVITTKQLTANIKYLRACLKSMSAKPIRIDKSSRQTAKLPSIYDFSCDKCPNRTISPEYFYYIYYTTGICLSGLTIRQCVFLFTAIVIGQFLCYPESLCMNIGISLFMGDSESTCNNR